MSKEKFVKKFSKWLKKNSSLPTFFQYDIFSEIHTDERGIWLISNFGIFRFFKGQNSWSKPREIALSRKEMLEYLHKFEDIVYNL